MRKFLLLSSVASFFISLSISAQSQTPVQFYFEKLQNNQGEFELKIKAVPTTGVHLFSIQKVSGDLPVNSNIHLIVL
jgi:ABC-type transporter MlaC component